MDLLALLPFALFLLGPLMMVFCFWGMRRMGCSTDSTPASDAAASTPSLEGLTPSEQAVALQAQLARLQSEQAAIASQLADLAATEPGASTESTPDTALPPHAIQAVVRS